MKRIKLNLYTFTQNSLMVHGARIELARRFHETDYESAATPFGVPWLVHNGLPGVIRTLDLLDPNQMLYQTEPQVDLIISYGHSPKGVPKDSPSSISVQKKILSCSSKTSSAKS